MWPDFISLNKGSESSCGAHPDGDYRPAVHRLNDLETPLSFGAVFGASAEARLRSAYKREKREYRSRHARECEEPDSFSPTAWHVERQDGRWLLEGWAGAHRMCEVGISYTADIDVSRVTGSRAPARVLPKPISGVQDAIVSADERWLLRIRQNEVALSPRETPERPVARAPLTGGDSVVMAEWARGANVSGWRDQVRTLAARSSAR